MNNELYCVLFINGMIGQGISVIAEDIIHDEALEKAKRMRSLLTRTDRSYYKSTYKVMPMSKIKSGKYAVLLGRV